MDKFRSCERFFLKKFAGNTPVFLRRGAAENARIMRFINLLNYPPLVMKFVDLWENPVYKNGACKPNSTLFEQAAGHG